MIVARCPACGLMKEVDDPVADPDTWPRCCDRNMRVAHFEIASRRKDEHARMARDLLAGKPKRLTWRRDRERSRGGKEERHG